MPYVYFCVNVVKTTVITYVGVFFKTVQSALKVKYQDFTCLRNLMYGILIKINHCIFVLKCYLIKSKILFSTAVRNAQIQTSRPEMFGIFRRMTSKHLNKSYCVSARVNIVWRCRDFLGLLNQFQYGVLLCSKLHKRRWVREKFPPSPTGPKVAGTLDF